MNEKLLRYYAGKLGYSEEVSDQCKFVRGILFTTNKKDTEKLEQILSYLKTENKLESDTFNFLNRGFRGHMGGEGYVLDMEFPEEAVFWKKFHELFPEHGDLALTAADALYLADNKDTKTFGPLFIRGMQLNGNPYGINGDVGSALLESEFRFDYQLLLLEESLKDGDEPEEELQELLKEYESDNDKMDLIRQKVEFYRKK